MAVDSINASLYADPTSLNGLKREAAAQSPQAIREAARQFEGLFTTMMLKSMRSASGRDPIFGSDQGDMYQDMFDQQMAGQLTRGKGIGLADMLVKQLMHSGDASAQAGQTGQTGKAGTAGTAATPAGVAHNTSAITGSTSLQKNQQDFVAALRPAATAAAQQLGVDPDTIIAHAALETGWGQSVPAAANRQSSFNLFGIKANAGWQGAAVASATHEFAGGQLQPASANFRAYDSAENSVQDYVRLLKGNPRYAAALGTGSDAAAFARGLQRGGYATDPDYVAKLSAVAARLKSGSAVPINTPNAV